MAAQLHSAIPFQIFFELKMKKSVKYSHQIKHRWNFCSRHCCTCLAESNSILLWMSGGIWHQCCKYFVWKYIFKQLSHLCIFLLTWDPKYVFQTFALAKTTVANPTKSWKVWIAHTGSNDFSWSSGLTKEGKK